MNKKQYKVCIEGGSLPDAEYLKNARCNEIERKDIIEQFGSWAVTKYGMDSLSFYYPIEKSRLRESYGDKRNGWDWERHMGEKRWVVMGDFRAALRAAIKFHVVPATEEGRAE